MTPGTSSGIGYLPAIFFQTDQSNVQYSFYPEMYVVATAIKQNPNIKVRIIGHTDYRNSETYNMSLGLRRAQSVANILSEYMGIPSEQLIVESKGYTEPITNSKAIDALQLNRRVQFELLDKKGLEKYEREKSAAATKAKTVKEPVEKAEAKTKEKTVKAKPQPAVRKTKTPVSKPVVEPPVAPEPVAVTPASDTVKTKDTITPPPAVSMPADTAKKDTSKTIAPVAPPSDNNSHTSNLTPKQQRDLEKKQKEEQKRRDKEVKKAQERIAAAEKKREKDAAAAAKKKAKEDEKKAKEEEKKKKEAEKKAKKNKKADT